MNEQIGRLENQLFSTTAQAKKGSLREVEVRRSSGR